MPVSALQHRVTVGLRQDKIKLYKHRCDMSFFNITIECIICVILCGLLRVSVGLWIEKLQISTVYIIISKDVCALPVIYDLITLLVLAYCNIVPLSNLIRTPIMDWRRVRRVSDWLEGINWLIICYTFFLYNYHLILIMRSGDIEENPGPNFLRICHTNIRSLSAVKLLAIKHEIVGKFDIISLSETFLSMESSTNLEIPGFHPLFRRDRGSIGEGVA